MKTNIVIGLLALLATIAVCAVLKVTSGVFVPLVIAWFLAQISQPIIMMGERLRLPHLVSVVLVFAAIFLVCFMGFKFAASQMAELERLFAIYSPKLNELVADVFDTLQIPLGSVSVIGILKRYVGSISGGVLNFSSQFFLTLIFLMFMLLEMPIWGKKVDRAFSGQSADRIRNIVASISRQTSQYLGTMVFISFLTGALVWTALAILGVELAAGWGILAFILNFVPTIGSVIASIPPVLMALLQFSPSYTPAIVTAAVVGVIQMATGNILAPKMFGDKLGLSPIVVMISLLIWGMIWGIPGAILSVPIASIIKIVCENIPALTPIAIMMGDRIRKDPPKKTPTPHKEPPA